MAARGHLEYRRADAAIVRRLGAGSATVGQLASLLDVSRQAARKAVGSLEARSLVRERADAHDARRRPYSLTARGERFRADLMEVTEELEREWSEMVSDEDLDGFRRVVATLVDRGDQGHSAWRTTSATVMSNQA